MLEQPDMSDVPQTQPNWTLNWGLILMLQLELEPPSKKTLLMITIAIVVLLLSIVGAYTWSRYDYCGLDQVQDGLDRIWGQMAGLKLPWQ